MKRIAALLTVFLMAVAAAAGGTAEEASLFAGPGREAAAEELVSAILSEQAGHAGQSRLQDWADGYLTENADGVGGWYLIALRRLQDLARRNSGKDAAGGTGGEESGEIGEIGFRKAREALENRAETETGSITRRERMALTLQALSGGSRFIRQTADLAAEETTLMPLIFGLHLMNNGAEAGTASRGEITERILKLQLADGGWAVIGDAGDADCTAMALQALAPLREDPDVATAVREGLRFLSESQLEDGGYMSMGAENAESCAQTVLALSSLGVDAGTDPDFRKNGFSVLDAMMRFRIPGEGFSHDLKSGIRNEETATVQCFCALAGYLSMLCGGGPWYAFDFLPAGDAGAPDIGISVKTWFYIAAGAVTALMWILALVRKKRNWRSYVFPLLAGAALAAAVAGIEIRSPEGYYGSATPAPDPERTMETFISIRCDSVAGEKEYAPENGVILAEESILLAEGQTAFDQLLECTRVHRIQMEYDGTTAGAYVRGIGYLYEFEFGNLSGWMYRVNGVYADTGCSQYRLKAGDRVEWVYTRSLGKDSPESPAPRE